MDLGHELLRLTPQMVRLGQRPEVRRPGGPDRTGHLHLAGVVCGLGQRPRAELVVEIAQVGGGGDGRFFGIQPLVDPAVDPEAVPARRRGHELPEALGSHARDRDRVEAALDHCRVGELLGQSPSLEHVSDHAEVASGPPDPEIDDGATIAGEAIEEDLDLGVDGDGIRWLRGGDRGDMGRFRERFGPWVDPGGLRLATGFLLSDGTDPIERLFPE